MNPVVGATDNDLPGASSTDPYLLVSAANGGPFKYPANYGTAGCQAYDATSPAQGCADASGNPLATAPAWCADQWCYVSETNCETATGATASTFFPGAFYSVETCAAAGASTSSYAAAQASSGGGGGTLASLQSTVETYLHSIAENVENAARARGSGCDASLACPCNRCRDNPAGAWSCSSDYTDLSSANLVFRTDSSQNIIDGDGNRLTPFSAQWNAHEQMKCMAMGASSSFTRIAAREHTDEDRIGFLMFGDQAAGGLLNWPANEWCTDSYDPRFRPWYAQSASGPKDVIVVIDISGSMAVPAGRSGKRIDMAKEAVAKIIKTMWWSDHATIVLFDDRTKVYEPLNGQRLVLSPMTTEEKEHMSEWAQTNIRPDGGTNFDVAFDTAFDIFDNSPATSACNKVILFMTDGQSSVNYNSVQTKAQARGVRIMTYALGNGAEQATCKRLACENHGVFSAVGDNQNLAVVMASYYKVFAAGRSRADQCKVSWTNYPGAVTPVEFMSACLPVFKTAAAAATCEARTMQGSFADLLGVVCMDSNIMATLPDLAGESDWDSWYQQTVIQRACQCPTLTLGHDELEALRAGMAVSGAQTCGASYQDDDNTARASGGSSTCGVGIEREPGNYACGMSTGILVVIVLAAVVGCVLATMAASQCKPTRRYPSGGKSGPSSYPVARVTGA